MTVPFVLVRDSFYGDKELLSILVSLVLSLGQDIQRMPEHLGYDSFLFLMTEKHSRLLRNGPMLQARSAYPAF